MPPSDSSPSGPATIIDQLRRRIVCGDLQPGSRLPNRTDLIGEFGGSMSTLQKAIDRLQAEGLLVVRGNEGTFVVEHPPFQHTYALLLPGTRDPDGTFTNLFYDGLRQAAAGIEKGSTVHFRLFSDVLPEDGGSWTRLVAAECTGDHVAGVIMPIPVAGLTPDHLAVPLATTRADEPPGNCVRAVLSEPVYFERAASIIAARGGRQVLALTLSDVDPDQRHGRISAALRAQGLTIADSAIVACDERRPAWARLAVRHAFQSPQPPDTLLVSDDHLLQPALAGLADVGLDATRVLVVSHANFPDAPVVAGPVVFLGYDLRHLLIRLIRGIDAQRATGYPPPAQTIVPILQGQDASGAHAALAADGTL